MKDQSTGSVEVMKDGKILDILYFEGRAERICLLMDLDLVCKRNRVKITLRIWSKKLEEWHCN